VEVRVRHKSGEIRTILFSAGQAVMYENGKPSAALVAGIDITDRKTAEMRLTESERRYRFLFDESPAGSVVLAPDGVIRDINEYFLRRLGYRREDVLDRSALDFMPPSEHARISSVIAKRLAGEQIALGDNLFISRDGAVHTVVFSGTQTLLYEGGTLHGILLAGEDVTERRKAEALAKRHEQELMQADKMASLGILVSGVAHEINNPNNFIILNADNLSDIWKDARKLLDPVAAGRGDLVLAGVPYAEAAPEAAGLINGISEGAKRIKNIVQNLKDFARQESGAMDQQVDLNKVIDAATVILANLIKKSTDCFVTQLADPLPPVLGNFQKIEQVVINLLTNACQALHDRSRSVTVRTAVESGEVVLTITDQGTGIEAENLSHIFDPFFTTKRDSGGTGLGLSISYAIVKDHGGRLRIDSEAGKGTVARVTLPL
jgi:PAS domain S-box-containing protein